jgi:hypothetical protein
VTLIQLPKLYASEVDERLVTNEAIQRATIISNYYRNIFLEGPGEIVSSSRGWRWPPSEFKCYRYTNLILVCPSVSSSVG